VSLIFFVGGALAAMAVDRLRRHVGSNESAQAENVQPAALTPATVSAAEASAAQPSAPAAAIVERLPAPEDGVPAAAPPATAEPPAPDITPPAPADARPEKRAVAAKASPVAHTGPASLLRPRRATPAPQASAAKAAATIEPPAFKAKAASKWEWVDPFAD
jgi:hypothetical protein